MKSVSIGELAEMLGVCTKTLRRWHAEGKLIPDFITPGSHRRYLLSSIVPILGLPVDKNNSDRINICYSRVSSSPQKDDLERQAQRLKEYTKTNKIKAEEIQDIGSGINYRKQGLQRLLRLIISSKVNVIYVTHRDRLMRFGFELIESIASIFGTRIVVVNSSIATEESFEQQLAADVIEIITVFSAKLYGKRSHQNKKAA
jgi:predicted site-specific integrase-resolvase